MSSREYPDRPWVGIGVIAFRGDDVLLVRRAKPPRMGEWSIPGGAQHLGETAEAAARRELLEEAGVTVGPLTVAVVVDALNHDEAGRARFHYTIIDFAGRWTGGEPVAGDDVSEARFFPPEALPGLGLWDEAIRAIAEGRKRLAG
ncbi:phosphohydrolase [Pseudoroseomonas rhizosphaerae]|uniref:Phosphohydrolase n=1 Tax=Teichococcus rhizosphaerae TaxID=1335062 RepID=A0A2C6Y741_9PROT|nr:NUDIX hydrolase [Pseudoroseomonas rhizosphaerae]PHK96632.1 phosphohydrolase [Pseudoroseomonas rhizosphaerae]